MTNAGPGTATGVTLTDALPAGSGISWTLGTLTPSGGFVVPDGACSITGTTTQTLSCAFGDMLSGQDVTVHVSSHTTSASCATYPNTATAQATNNPAVSADASVTVQCPGGLIAPTLTTCQDFVSGTAATLGQINYSVSGGKIAQSINPGVFFYYTKITTTLPNQVVTVSQSNTSTNGAALFQVLNGQAYLYSTGCTTLLTGTLNATSTGASFIVPTPGTYIISIKYSAKSIAGTKAPAPVDINVQLQHFTGWLNRRLGAVEEVLGSRCSASREGPALRRPFSVLGFVVIDTAADLLGVFGTSPGGHSSSVRPGSVGHSSSWRLS